MTHFAYNAHVRKVLSHLRGNLAEDPPHASDKKKTNKHKHFGRDGVRDKQELSLGQSGTPPLGQIGTCPWDKPAVFCLIPQ